MTWENSLALATLCFVAMVTPGPGVMALVGHALAGGFRRSIGFILGMVSGDLVFLTLAILGMAALAHAFEELFVAIRFAAACYLIYLGIRTWRAVPKVFDALRKGDEIGRKHHAKGYVSGLAVTLSNPKVIIFYIGVLPGFVDLSTLSAGDVVVVTGIVVGVLASLMAGYALAAGRARNLLKSERALRRLNRGSGSVMIGAGIFIAARG